MAEDKKGRTIRGDGFFFAPLPNFAQNGTTAIGETIASFEPPRVRIGRANNRAVADKLRATLLQPGEAPARFEFLAKNIRKRLEVTRVVARVSFHARCERALG